MMLVRKLILLLLAVTVLSCELPAVEIFDPLTSDKLNDAWIEQKSDKGKPTITGTKDGLLIRCEPRLYAAIKRRNEIVGTDRNPLTVSCYIKTDGGFATHPSLILYWDNDNYISLLAAWDNHFQVAWRTNTSEGQRPFYHTVPDSNKSGTYVRAILTSQNCYVAVSSDGVNWRRLADMGFRPKPGVAPVRIILGRGWPGERGSKDAKPDMANDAYPDASKTLIASTFRDFSLRDTPLPLAATPLELQAKDDWDKTLEAVEASGVPRSWTLLGPRPDRDFKLFARQLEPDTTDDWKTAPRDEANKPFRISTWSHPEDDANPYVDLAEVLDPNTHVLAYARTEVDWPSDGPACLWIDDNGRIKVAVNSRWVYSDEGREQSGAVKDRYCVPITMKKGKNVIKVKSGQNRGAWGFVLRLERNDPAYRIQLLEKLMELHPAEAAGWRGAQAMMEIARRYEDLLQFEKAAAAWQAAIEKFSNVDEYREEALEGKLRLYENLKDWAGLLAAGEQYLAKYPTGTGTDRAFQACVLGECCLQKFPAAEARVAKYVEAAGRDGRKVLWAMRVLAGACEAGGDVNRKYAALEKAADNPIIEQPERARAALEDAFWRVGAEFWRVSWPQQQKLDPASLTAACAAARKGIALLSGGSIPIVQDFIKEADDDLKAGRHERAIAGYWGAAFMAICASNPEAKPYLGINKSYKLPSINIDPATKKPREPNDQVKQEAWNVLGQALNEVKWLGPNWRAIGPFDNTDGIGERTAYGPETANDMTTPHPGRGGQKHWIDLDPKAQHELGQTLQQLGDCKGGIAYVSREFECPDNRTTNLYIAVRAGWTAWLDGQQVGSRSEDWFRLDGNRIPITLKPGKHRLLLKLICPGDDPFTVRVRVSDEPELGLNVLRIAWLQREFPEIARYYLWYGDLYWLMGFQRWKTNGETIETFGDALATLYPAQSEYRWNFKSFTLERLMEYGEYGDATEGFRALLMRLETWAETPDRVAQISWVTNQLYSALAAQGEMAAADEVLRTFIARHPDFYQGTGQALVNRGCLRQDFAIAQPSRPYFERAIREYPNADYNFRFAGPGLAFARTYLPERLQFEMANDVQTAIEAATRQMKTGNPQDVERAMRNLSEAIRNGSGGMIRISDSRIAPLYVGVREYFRALLATLNDEMRGVYLKTVADISQQRYQRAAENNSIAALEAVAGEYHYTPAAAMAINRAGNLYLDRGAWSQAATAFKYLLQEYKGVEGFNEALVAAKYARALLLDAQYPAAKTAAEVLTKDYNGKSITVAGENVPVSQFAQRIIDQTSKASTGKTHSSAASETFCGNQARTGAPLNAPAPKPGPVAWARPYSQSASMDQARSRFYPDPFRHIQPYPVVSGNRAYIASQDSVQVLDLNSGQTLWKQIWGSGGSPLPGQFAGFPMCCPTVSDGRLCMRILNGRQSALNCFDAESGRLQWSTAGIPELKRTIWISDPLVAYGMAVAAYIEPGDRNLHGVAAFDLQTGRMRWKTQLVTGSTGFRIGNDYYATTLQIGPPAAERGIIYTATGLNSLAAINAFSGEVVWVTGYPRIQTGVAWNGFAGNTGDLRNRVLKLLARGPASPVVTDDLVVLAPRDCQGVIAFERKSGNVRWRDDLLDSRFIAGVCDGNILFVDTTVKAVNINTGNLAWEYALPGDMLYGAPGYSGGILYLPGEESLSLLDARTGRLQQTIPWDSRTGPVANFTITPQMIVGASESHAVAFAPEGGAKHELPLLEARQAVAAGNSELAADRFYKAIQSPDTDDVMPALSGWVEAMDKLGKKDEALKALDALLQDKPALLEAPASYWRVSKSVFADGLRARLGQAPAAPEPVTRGLPGALVYAWQLQGENPRMFFPREGPQDRFFAWAGNYLYSLRLSASFDILWQVYVGPDANAIAIGPTAVAVSSGQKLSIIDRDTGETLWRMPLPSDKKRRRARANASAFGHLAIDENSVAFIAGDGLFCYDLRTRKERWANERGQRKTLYLTFSNGKVGEVGSVGQGNRFYTTYDPMTGNRIDNLQLGAGGDWTRTVLSDDGKLLIYRPHPHAILAVDLFNAKKAWEVQVPNLDVGYWHWTNLRIKDGVLSYNGDARDGPDKGYVTYFFNLTDGKEVKKMVGGAGREAGSYVYGREPWGKIVTRADDDGKGGMKEVWKTTLPDHLAHYHYGIESQLTKNLLHSVYVREGNGDQYVLRTWDWETGQVLQNEFIPGTPFRDYGNVIRDTVEFHGNLLLYAGSDGIFAYTAAGQTRNENVAKLKEQLAQPNLSASQRRDSRRALTAIDPPAMQAFLAPAGARADGDLSEWDQTEPLTIQAPQNYVPLTDDATPKTPQDLSAKIYSAWGADGVYLAVDVADDKFSAPRAGAPLNTGDSVCVYINSTSEPWYGFKNYENIVCSLALVDGRTVMNVWPEPQDSDEGKVTGAVVRAPDGRGARYELFIPWAVLRREPWLRPADRKELRLGIAAYDDDGEGVKGAVEWGAAVTSPTLAPMRLGQLSLLDISREKIERYRKVIDKLPDTPESTRFMDLILLSKRGATADQERIAELEGFVKAHPSAASTNRVLSSLRDQYAARGEADPVGKTLELAKNAKCPANILDNVKGKVLKVWVLPDEKNPPKMIMVQFNVRGWGWARRAYWGQPAVDWGRDGSGERKPMGPLPKPGQWTQLEIRPVDFDMEEQDIAGLAFTTFGGLVHWDRVSAVVGGKETELINDAAPANFRFEGSPLQFVDNPKHDGQKSWTGGATAGLLNSHFYAPNDLWFSFKSPAAGPAAAVDAKVAQGLYRDAANILPDTPEGLVFLKRVIELLDQKDKAYTANCIAECEKYLQAHPDTQNALAILQMLRSYYQAGGDRNPVIRCEALMKQVKLSRDNCRAFYSAFAPAWTDFHVIGPFPAVGDRRGMDQFMPPERNVDLSWTPKAYADVEQAWTKQSFAKDDKGKSNDSGYVNLYPVLSAKLEQKDKQQLLRGPYFAYSYVKFNVPTKRRALLLYGANDVISIWVNGRREVNEAAPGNAKDREFKAVQLANGMNEILIKVGVREQQLGFFFRIADENGRPFDDVTFP